MKFLQSKINKVLVIHSALLLLFTNEVCAQTDTVQTNLPALKDVYKNDFTIGCLLSYAHVGFPTDPFVPGQSNIVAPNGGNLIKFHMNSMSPGNWMKSTYIVDIPASASAYDAATTQEERDSVDVNPVVRFNGNIIAQLNWAQRQGFTFRGNTLVWHNQNPGPAFFRSGYTTNGTRLSPDEMAERMENFIKEVIRIIHESWPGLLTAMDVVNEAVNDNGTDRSANNEWYTTFGDISYVKKAFEYTRKYTDLYGETQMKLYYNDYNTHVSSKADGIVRICQPIFEAGYLDGIGMQDHDGYNSPTAEQWIASYNKFAAICSEISVTELDVRPSSNNLTTNVLTTQANQYAMLFKCFVDRSYRSGRGKIVNVSKDGLNDEWAFVDNASLWDANNQAKPAFFASVNVGLNYNALDSLISFTDTLVESEYTDVSWANLADALSNEQSVMARNYSYQVSAADALGEAKDSLNSAIGNLVLNTTAVEGSNENPKRFALSQNYPNPFNPETRIAYSVARPGWISLKIYNLQGQEVTTLFEGMRPAGNYVATLAAAYLAGGVYVYRLKGPGFTESKKMLLLK
jgi:endo-1,4-beta-xylanase